MRANDGQRAAAASELEKPFVAAAEALALPDTMARRPRSFLAPGLPVPVSSTSSSLASRPIALSRLMVYLAIDTNALLGGPLPDPCLCSFPTR